MSYIQNYCREVSQIVMDLDYVPFEKISISLLLDVRKNSGRLFFLGVGGSAANCSHAVVFRKIGGFEAYTPVDNVAELTARTNDEGWNSVFEGWLKGSRLNANDAVFVFSVGGETERKKHQCKLGLWFGLCQICRG